MRFPRKRRRSAFSTAGSRQASSVARHRTELDDVAKCVSFARATITMRRGLEVPAEPLLVAFDENKAVRDVLLKFTQAMIAQISQIAACNRLHRVRERYARWLLE